MEFIPPKVVSENTFEEAKLEFIRLDKNIVQIKNYHVKIQRGINKIPLKHS